MNDDQYNDVRMHPPPPPNCNSYVETLVVCPQKFRHKRNPDSIRRCFKRYGVKEMLMLGTAENVHPLSSPQLRIIFLCPWPVTEQRPAAAH